MDLMQTPDEGVAAANERLARLRRDAADELARQERRVALDLRAAQAVPRTDKNGARVARAVVGFEAPVSRPCGLSTIAVQLRTYQGGGTDLQVHCYQNAADEPVIAPGAHALVVDIFRIPDQRLSADDAALDIVRAGALDVLAAAGLVPTQRAVFAKAAELREVAMGPGLRAGLDALTFDELPSGARDSWLRLALHVLTGGAR